MPLTRRASLAVVAHIRHTYTDYDRLLRIGSWEQARSAVEQLTLDKLVQWRADEDDNADAMSDILREVIVIADDDEDGQDADASGLKSQSHRQQRDSSVEIISSQAGAETLQTQQISYRDLQEPDPEELVKPKETESYVYTQQPQQDQRRLDRSDAHRRQAWQDARFRRRQDPAATVNRLPLQGRQGPGRSPVSHVQPYPFPSTGKDAVTKVIDLTMDRPTQKLDVWSKVSLVIITQS